MKSQNSLMINSNLGVNDTSNSSGKYILKNTSFQKAKLILKQAIWTMIPTFSDYSILTMLTTER